MALWRIDAPTMSPRRGLSDSRSALAIFSASRDESDAGRLLAPEAPLVHGAQSFAFIMDGADLTLTSIGRQE